MGRITDRIKALSGNTSERPSIQELSANHEDLRRKVLSARELAKGADERYRVKAQTHRAFEAQLAEAVDEPTAAQLVELKALAGESAELRVVADLWSKRLAAAEGALADCAAELKQHQRHQAEKDFAEARTALLEAISTLREPYERFDRAWHECQRLSISTDWTPNMGDVLAWAARDTAEAAKREASKPVKVDPLRVVRFLKGTSEVSAIADSRFPAYFAGDTAGFEPSVSGMLVATGVAEWAVPGHSAQEGLVEAARRRIEIAAGKRQARPAFGSEPAAEAVN